MSRIQAENVIKNAIYEIVKQCAAKGKVVSENLVAFVVKAIVLDDRNGFQVDQKSEYTFAEELIKICINRLMEKNSPSLDTYQMQVYFDLNYTKQEEFFVENNIALDQRTQTLVREITDNKARTKDELEFLYVRIVSYLILRSGLGSPTDINVVRESTAALRSVFPQTELGSFLQLSKLDKERQLVELTSIVTGIRLFNKSVNKGGESIEDIPDLLQDAISTALKNISSEITKVTQNVFIYTDVLESAAIARKFPATLDWLKLKEAHFNTRQHEHFLNILQHDVRVCEEIVQIRLQRFDQMIELLKNTVASKTAVPTSQVYPLFIELAQVWQELQNTISFIRLLSNIVLNLKQFAITHLEMFPDDVIKTYISSNQITDEDRMKMSNLESNKIIASKICNEEITVLHPESTMNFGDLSINFKGFCPWMLHTYGILIPSNPRNGILCYKNMYYAFSKPEAAYSFSVKPDEFIEGILCLAKKSPELILLLDLYKFDILSFNQAQDSSLTDKLIIKCDVDTQTEVHPIESNLVKSYEWNEWELRRKAIKLANLRQKITHSMQTDLSHFRRDNISQVYLPKDTDTQTSHESSTNVPKHATFLSGLRGCQSKRTNMAKVDLTVDIEQT
ncbi:cilia- and flagella-associated protein 206 isoform X3 [Hydra vulgaris]|uniref:Cilia- and flagella-associated protein 206 n=1 Tax=Hydra vulgaris TaxID=6087 RepID=A0ABM4BL52_HYDVU